MISNKLRNAILSVHPKMIRTQDMGNSCKKCKRFGLSSCDVYCKECAWNILLDATIKLK